MSECSCDACKKCCERMPGVFMPDEVKKAADYLNMPLNEFLKKYCIAGWRENLFGNDEHIDFVYPAKVGWEGKREDWGYPLGEGICCLLTKDKLCKIHPAKPYECRLAFGCCKHKKGMNYRDKCIKAWQKARDKLEPEIKEFLGIGEEYE